MATSRLPAATDPKTRPAARRKAAPASGAAAEGRRLFDTTRSFVSSLLNIAKLGQPSGYGSYQPVPERVIYLLHNAHPFHNGGYAVRGHGILRAVRTWGFDAHAVVRPGYPWDRLKDAPDMPPVTLIDQVPYHYPERGSASLEWVTSNRYLDSYVEDLKRRCRELRPAVLHAASFFQNGVAAVRAARQLGIPVIYEMRGLSILNEMSKRVLPEGEIAEIRPRIGWEFELELEAARKADHVLAITETLREVMIEHGVAPDRISLLPNGVDVQRFTAAARNPKLVQAHGLEGQFVIGFIGSVQDYEGLDDLVEGLARLAAGGRTDWRLLVVGDGPYLPRLQELVKRRQLGERVIFTGRVPHAQVGELYALCDLMVYPRKPLPVCEAISPIKPLEPMALGIPVLCSDVGALREMVVDGVNGYCFPKGDPKALADRLLAFMEGRIDVKPLQAQSRAWVEENRDWRQLTRPVAELYRRLYLEAGGRRTERDRRSRIVAAAAQGRAAELAAWKAELGPEAGPMPVFDLAAASPAPEIRASLEDYQGRHPERTKIYPDPEVEMSRLSWALDRLPGGERMLDVGPSLGILLNGVARKGLYRELTGVDLRPYATFLNPDGRIDYRRMSVTALDFPDRHFDTVCCLEVLEHLAETDLDKALAELRRVCGGTLLVSVPFREPAPISKFHRIRFDEARLRRLFPDAEIALLLKRDTAKWHWAFCIERPGSA
jgi:glycosyltransferase involved in cell wall biosynthesis